MKKFLTFILVLAMVLSVSSFAMAAETYTDWTDSTSLPKISGNYKLTTDVTITSTVTIGAWSGSTTTVKLDLNGHTVTVNVAYGTGLYVQNSGNLIIEDSVGTGKITSSVATYILQVKGSCQIDGGTIENTYASGTALYVQNGDNKQASCTMNGGTILNSYDKSGIAVSVGSNATFTMNGGTVENKAVGTDGTVAAIDGGAASSKIIINDGNIKAAGTGIKSSGAPVEISGGEIEAGYYALETRYATVDGTAEITADKALLKPYSAPSSGDGNVIEGGTFEAPELIAGSTIDGNEKNAQISGGTFTGGVDPSTHTGDTLVAKIGDKTIVGEEAIEAAANSQSNVTVEPISGKGDLDLDTSKGNQVKVTDSMADKVTINGNALQPNASPQQIPSRPQAPAPNPSAPSTGGGYYYVGVRYNGGNSFSTDRSDVPVAVLIDGQPVGFTGNGSNFVVDCINPGASRITIVWNTIKVDARFTPDANAYCTQTVIPKTGGMSIWAAIAQFLGF